jgi:hypothetical protein
LSGTSANDLPFRKSTSKMSTSVRSVSICWPAAARIRRLRAASTSRTAPLGTKGSRILRISLAEMWRSGTMRAPEPFTGTSIESPISGVAVDSIAPSSGTTRYMSPSSRIVAPLSSRTLSSAGRTAERGRGWLVCIVIDPWTAGSTA